MNRLLVAAAVSSLALSGAAAEAAKKKPSPRAKVFHAKLAPSVDSTISGKAQVVDNKKSDSAKLQIKGGVTPGAVYDWSIFRVQGTGDACDPANGGETVSSFRYRTLKVTEGGTASATTKSKSFSALSNKRYAIAVTDGDGERVACGELKRKKPAAKKK